MIVRTRPRRWFGLFRKPSAIQIQWGDEPCPDPRWNGRHLEVMFQHWGTPYCGCPPCDAVSLGFSIRYNDHHPYWVPNEEGARDG